MTQADKDAQLAALQSEAKDYQARYGFLVLQSKSIEDELVALRTLLQAGGAKFARVKDAQVAEVEAASGRTLASDPLVGPEIIRAHCHND